MISENRMSPNGSANLRNDQPPPSTDSHVNGGFFEFDDGGWYAGDWVNGQAYGYGTCTGPQEKGEYSGTWKEGFELLGVYTWPKGHWYSGQWLDGKRHGLGAEAKGSWVYKGEWTNGSKGKYGLKMNTNSEARYEGMWSNGVQEGFGVETYMDESTYQGEWVEGKRHGLGVRKSAPRGIASIFKTTDRESNSKKLLSLLREGKHISVSSQENTMASNLDVRRHDDSDRSKGGFVLVDKLRLPSSNKIHRSRSFSISRNLNKRFKLGRSESISALQKISFMKDDFFSEKENTLRGSADTGKNCLVACSVDVNLATAIETYMGEWKDDKRNGFGISERSDGLRYEGEWINDKKSGYGVTFYQNGTKEEGKYKNNELINFYDHKRKLFTKKKFKDKIETAVASAKKSADAAVQKSELAQTKKRTALAKSVSAEQESEKAHYLAAIARQHADKFLINFEKMNKQTNWSSSENSRNIEYENDEVFDEEDEKIEKLETINSFTIPVLDKNNDSELSNNVSSFKNSNTNSTKENIKLNSKEERLKFFKDLDSQNFKEHSNLNFIKEFSKNSNESLDSYNSILKMKYDPEFRKRSKQTTLSLHDGKNFLNSQTKGIKTIFRNDNFENKITNLKKNSNDQSSFSILNSSLNKSKIIHNQTETFDNMTDKFDKNPNISILKSSNFKENQHEKKFTIIIKTWFADNFLVLIFIAFNVIFSIVFFVYILN